MKTKIEKKIDCLKMKWEAQERISCETRGMKPEEYLNYLKDSVEKGPLGGWWNTMKKNQKARRKAA